MLRKFYLDNPISRAMLFYPRRAQPSDDLPPHVHDGSIEAGNVTLGYRLYTYEEARAVVLYFHGNGDVVSDYDDVALLFAQIGAALFVAEYRGYGWSSGRARGSTLLPDAETTLHRLPDVLVQHSVPNLPLFVMGYSLGSAPAIHLAYQFPECFKGLIVQSGFAHAPSAPIWPRPMKIVMPRLPGLFNNREKMRHITLPTLIFHGERDVVITVEQAQMLYDVSPSPHKILIRIPDEDHGRGMLIRDREIKTLDDFIAAHIES